MSIPIRPVNDNPGWNRTPLDWVPGSKFPVTRRQDCPLDKPFYYDIPIGRESIFIPCPLHGGHEIKRNSVYNSPC